MPRLPDSDMLGRRIGRLTVISEAGPMFIGKAKEPRRSWNCICDCGNSVRVLQGSLLCGKTSSCGCWGRERASEANRGSIPLGSKFGKLTVVSLVPHIPGSGGTRYVCKCDCGKEKAVTLKRLRNGHTRSCGCLITDIMKLRTGPKSPQWKPSLTDEDRELRVRRHTMREVVVVRKVVQARDHYTCLKCGAKSVLLHAHHILAWASHPEARFDPNNLVTLCAKCHYALHKVIRGCTEGLSEDAIYKQWMGGGNERIDL